tara:strand:- start:29 stop:403 length:375 start_codon:yes stop_codon:yes gene_type:complete
MTRKHFIEIAQNFNMDIIFHLNNDRTGTALAVYYAATHLCPCFGRSNSSFDEARFKQALIVNITRTIGCSNSSNSKGIKTNKFLDEVENVAFSEYVYKNTNEFKAIATDEIENMSDLSDFFCNG